MGVGGTRRLAGLSLALRDSKLAPPREESLRAFKVAQEEVLFLAHSPPPLHPLS